MTVAKQKKTAATLKVTKKVQEPLMDLSSLDTLMQKIDALEMEEQVSELFEEETLLKESLEALLTLANSAVSDEDLDTEKIDENVMEIMSKFLEEAIVDEEEFEDFFITEELEGEDFGDSEADEAEEEGTDVSGYESDASDDQKTAADIRSVEKDKKKKSKHLRELEMLMEKVEDESDLDDEEYESENENETEGSEDEMDFEESEGDEMKKRDIFAEDKGEDSNRMSSFEKSQATLKAEIAALEAETLESTRPWALRGEINARQRPSDSLLEEAVDFDSLARPTPQITEERSEEIEDVIKRRIEEAAWDDVERKDGRDLTLLNGMSSSTQKSARPLLEDVATAGPHRSLTQVYEQEATDKLTGHSALDQATREKQSDLTALFAKICRHVDGLSGNRFAPKVYVQSDFQVKTLGNKK